MDNEVEKNEVAETSPEETEVAETVSEETEVSSDESGTQTEEGA